MHKRLLLPFQVHSSLLIWGPLTALSHHYLPSHFLSFAWGHLTLAFRPQVFSLIGWLALVSATSLCIMLLSSSVAGLLRSCELPWDFSRLTSLEVLLWPCTPLHYTLFPTLISFTLCWATLQLSVLHPLQKMMKLNVPCVFQGNKNTIRDIMSGCSCARHQAMWTFNSKFWMIFWIISWMEVGFLETGGRGRIKLFIWILWGSSVIPQGNPQDPLRIQKLVENFSVQRCLWKNTQTDKQSAILTGQVDEMFNSRPYVIS